VSTEINKLKINYMMMMMMMEIIYWKKKLEKELLKEIKHSMQIELSLKAN